MLEGWSGAVHAVHMLDGGVVLYLIRMIYLDAYLRLRLLRLGLPVVLDVPVPVDLASPYCLPLGLHEILYVLKIALFRALLEIVSPFLGFLLGTYNRRRDVYLFARK